MGLKKIKNWLRTILMMVVFTLASVGIGIHPAEASSKIDSNSTEIETTEILSLKNTVKGIKIKWKTVPGVKGYWIFRKYTNSSLRLWDGIAKLQNSKTDNYVDEKAYPGTTYDYAVVPYTVDSYFLAGYIKEGGQITRNVPASIKLDKTSATLYIGSQLTLKATVTGNSTTVKWISGNPKIATVKDGVITPKKTGKVTIKAKANGKVAKCKITVKVDKGGYKRLRAKASILNQKDLSHIKIGKKTFSIEESSGGAGYYPICVTENGVKKTIIPDNDVSVVTTNGTFVYYSTKYSGNIYRLYRYDINSNEKKFILAEDHAAALYCDGTYLYYGSQAQYVGVIEKLKIMNLKTGNIKTMPYSRTNEVQPVKNRLLVSDTGSPHGGPFYLMDKNGANSKKITEEFVGEVKVSGNYIYYTELRINWDCRFCRCDLDGKNVKYLTGWVSWWDTH